MTPEPASTGSSLSIAAPTDDARSVMDSVRRIVRAVRVWGRACERDLGLGGAQLFILQKIRDGEPVSINDLAARTLTHQSSVSAVVSRLVEKGLVDRHASQEDARRMEVSLTRAGRALLDQAPRSPQESMISAVLRMPAAEARRLAMLLDTMVREAGLFEDGIAPLFEEESSAPGRKRKIAQTKGPKR